MKVWTWDISFEETNISHHQTGKGKSSTQICPRMVFGDMSKRDVFPANNFEGSPLPKFTSANNRNAPEILFLSRNGLSVFLRWMLKILVGGRFMEIQHVSINLGENWVTLKMLTHGNGRKLEVWMQMVPKRKNMLCMTSISCEDA